MTNQIINTKSASDKLSDAQMRAIGSKTANTRPAPKGRTIIAHGFIHGL